MDVSLPGLRTAPSPTVCVTASSQFGVVQDGITRKARRLAALAQPVLARRLGADGVGVTLAVVCPYCREEHRQVFDDDALAEWDPETLLEAACRRGGYRLRWD